MNAEVGLVIALLLAIAAIAVVARPLRTTPHEGGDDDTAFADLLALRETAFQSLRDLDSDLASGRLAEDDYRPMRVLALSQAAEVVAKLDALQASADAAPGDESALRVARNGEQDAGFCSNCGAPRQPDDVYCRRCGQNLKQVRRDDST